MTQGEMMILEKLGEMNVRLDGIDRRLDEMDMRLDAMDSRMDRMEQHFTDEIRKLHILIETDISRKIDIIGEGHSFLGQQMDEVVRLGKRWEQIGLNQINLKMDVDRIKTQLCIA